MSTILLTCAELYARMHHIYYFGMKMYTDLPPRPAWNHKEVKHAAAFEIVDEVQEWAVRTGCVGHDEDRNQFQALVVIAIQECPDSYNACRYLEDFYDWPVDRDLLNVLDKAYRRMTHHTVVATHNWVTENTVRVPAKKGQGVRIRVGEHEITGTVVDIITREARAIVLLTGRNSKVSSVLAEFIVESWDIGKTGKSPNSGHTA